MSEERIINFPKNQKLPEGWQVIQLDSGHYMGVSLDGKQETAITVNRFHARKWAIDLARTPQ